MKHKTTNKIRKSKRKRKKIKKERRERKMAKRREGRKEASRGGQEGTRRTEKNWKKRRKVGRGRRRGRRGRENPRLEAAEYFSVLQCIAMCCSVLLKVRASVVWIMQALLYISRTGYRMDNTLSFTDVTSMQSVS